MDGWMDGLNVSLQHLRRGYEGLKGAPISSLLHMNAICHLFSISEPQEIAFGCQQHLVHSAKSDFKPPNRNLCIHLDDTGSAVCGRCTIKFVWAYVSRKKQRREKCSWWGEVSEWVKGRPRVKSDSHILHTHEPASTWGSGVYLLEAAHKVVANWRSGQVGCARAPANIEEVIGAEHSVVFLGVTCGSQNPIHWYGHLDTKHRERTHYTQTELQHCTLVPFSPSSSSSLW